MLREQFLNRMVLLGINVSYIGFFLDYTVFRKSTFCWEVTNSKKAMVVDFFILIYRLSLNYFLCSYSYPIFLII